MKVTLKNNTPLSVLVEAIRTCWDSGEQSDSFFPDISPYPYFDLGVSDKKLVQAVIKKNHTSTLEHLWYNFKIEGISRLNLQELARHRMASLSVKSSRYTLKELKGEEEFNPISPEDFDRASKYINFVNVAEIDYASMVALENLRHLIEIGIPNDQAKYALPECYKVDLMWSINARSLRNFLELRTDKSAHFEIRELANLIYINIPTSHKFLYKDSVKVY
jgi:thymidylate synthase (FAD)